MASEAESRQRTYWRLQSRTCDSCKTTPAILFCRADSAFLCGACDARVHSANKLASRHERVWLCEVCEQAPAAVTCKADAAALCASCDADIHSANPLARRHHRLPVVPFFDSALNAKNHHHQDLLGVDDAADDQSQGLSFLNLKSATVVDDEVDLKSADYFFSDVDPYLDLDNYAATDSVVPVQPHKTAAAAFGIPTPHPPALDFDFPAKPLPSYSTYSVCSSDVGVVPDEVQGDASTGYMSGGGGGGSGRSTVAPQPMTGMDREARVMRYREKRKNRRFEKTIRYASRKANAETRPRIKGRFAKRTEVEAEVEMGMYSYGVVPSF